MARGASMANVCSCLPSLSLPDCADIIILADATQSVEVLKLDSGEYLVAANGHRGVGIVTATGHGAEMKLRCSHRSHRGSCVHCRAASLAATHDRQEPEVRVHLRPLMVVSRNNVFFAWHVRPALMMTRMTTSPRTASSTWTAGSTGFRRIRHRMRSLRSRH